MSDALGFLAKFTGKKFGNAANGLAVWLASKDPATATEVDIDNLRENFEAFGKEVAEYEPREEETHRIMASLQEQLGRAKQAGSLLGGQLRTATEGGNTSSIDSLTHQLTPVLAKIEEIGGDEGDGSKSGTLFDAIVDHQQAEDDLHQVQALHAGAAKALTESRAAAERKKSELARVQRDEARQAERLDHAEHLAQLSSRGPGVGSAAFSAIDASIAASKARSRASQVNADALTRVQTTNATADDIIAQTLAGAPPSPTSALDRLAKLTGSKAA
jgi:chromosome segregation ATPase